VKENVRFLSNSQILEIISSFDFLALCVVSVFGLDFSFGVVGG